MRTHKLKNPVLSLLLVFISFTSCNGQAKRIPANESAVPQLSFTSKNASLIKTQDTNKYQYIHCGLQDKNGNLWFGTTGEGVYQYDGKAFTQFAQKDGLSNNKVWSILEDQSGNTWVGTDNGVSRYCKTIVINRCYR